MSICVDMYHSAAATAQLQTTTIADNYDDDDDQEQAVDDDDNGGGHDDDCVYSMARHFSRVMSCSWPFCVARTSRGVL